MRIYINLVFAVISIFLMGCSNSKEDEPSNSLVETEYYVKYEATVKSAYSTNNISYTVATDNQIQTFKSGKSFTETFGPFKKGFEAYITADARNLYSANCDVRIYISRGNEPFALKANKSGGKLVSTSYKIDY